MEIATTGRCPRCGEALSSDDLTCPACGAQRNGALKRPHFTFAVLIFLLVVGFTVTGFIVRGFDARREQLAERWFQRGNRDLRNGAATQAIDEYQTALAYSRDNDTYRLKLAMALMQAGKWEEARAHLLNIWEQRPGDGEVNLLLARVFANRNLASSAIRYYQGAIYGVWESDPIGNRESARFELVDYLLAQGRKDAAQAELIALAGETPAAPAAQLHLAQLMLKAGEPQRALDIFQQLRHKQRDNFDINFGAAQAEFQLTQFSRAAQFAKDALTIHPASQPAKDLANEAEALVASDPRSHGLNAAERARRALLAYHTASDRLSSCADSRPTDVALQQLASAQRDEFATVKATTLRDQDIRDRVLRWVFDVETSTAKVCGAPSGQDATLLTLWQAQEKER